MSTMPALQSATHAPQPARELHRWYMVVDGNRHRSDLCTTQPAFAKPFMLSEALIPQVRLVAMLIAAERVDFSRATPDILSDEADWFAARILVLGVRVFHLDITLMPMLKLANKRAAAFARKHGLPFEPAQMRMSLHAGRPNHMLIMETDETVEQDCGMIHNSLHLSRRLNALQNRLLEK